MYGCFYTWGFLFLCVTLQEKPCNLGSIFHVYGYTYVRTYIHTYIRASACISTCIHVDISRHTCSCIHMHAMHTKVGTFVVTIYDVGSVLPFDSIDSFSFLFVIALVRLFPAITWPDTSLEMVTRAGEPRTPQDSFQDLP